MPVGGNGRRACARSSAGQSARLRTARSGVQVLPGAHVVDLRCAAHVRPVPAAGGYGPVAQLVEQPTLNRPVVGSSPTRPTSAAHACSRCLPASPPPVSQPRPHAPGQQPLRGVAQLGERARFGSERSQVRILAPRPCRHTGTCCPVVQLAERPALDREVPGSNPGRAAATAAPQTATSRPHGRYHGMWRSLVSALASGARGRRFESGHPDHPQPRGRSPRGHARPYRRSNAWLRFPSRRQLDTGPAPRWRNWQTRTVQVRVAFAAVGVRLPPEAHLQQPDALRPVYPTCVDSDAPAAVAQLEEHRSPKPGVGGSSPSRRARPAARQANDLR